MHRHNSETYIHLDLARALAAILVMIGHLRSYLFTAPSQLEHVTLTQNLFYFVTGFGREAVIIFFVLSGFFITKSIVGMVNRGAWSWSNYLIDRLARLWTVLIPALLLTLFWDQIGIGTTDSNFYVGGYIDQYLRGPSPPVGIQSNLTTFIGNVFFLQTIETSVFGTNFPLWSLAYEFWYYILFPLAFIPFATKQSAAKKLASLLLFVTIIFWLPAEIVLLGAVWLNGALVFYLTSFKRLTRIMHHPLPLVAALLLLLLTLCTSRVGLLNEGLALDLLIGFTFSLVMLGVIHRKSKCKLCKKSTTEFSNMSYTLYLVHDSFIAFIACYFLHNKVTTVSLPTFLFFFVVTLVYSYIIYYLFERHTKRVSFFAKKSY